MKRWPLALMVAATPAAAQLDQRALDRAVARPAAGVALPDLRFTDERGRSATLAEVAGGRPLVLLFADYTCRHVCGPGLTLTAAALGDSGLVAGRDYRVAVIGLDPKDTAADARTLGARIAAPEVRRATRLLLALAPVIAAATRRLGYGYAYDAATDQYAHDASVYVFGADGRLRTLLPELGLRPESIRAALTGQPSSPGLADRIARLCYGLDAAHGRYGRPVALALQLLAAATLVALATLLWRRRRPA